ncbi:sensor histidine kinase [Sphingosinicella microcystinivorans]|uniref:histidine kinase n=2 Tax=Sphingosinicella microcystinivorans TaxID=335406 RepID=A0ABX9SYE2_SPHMI|nr:PAS domain-containing sensor histidine kinase [Sphingosinicella microcystinivorans]RKS88876.1 two-component sensor histidine kinase [Sphingosinicella microcystinivorans]
MPLLHFLEGGGKMGDAIRAFDWSTTPLGPAKDWSPTLKSAVALVLSSRFPKCLVWGTELICIYNDAFEPILGSKPAALGRPFNEVWSEVWSEIGPIVERAFEGEATFIEDFAITLNRHGYPEQAWFTFCYSPVRDEWGNVVGMIDTVIETTAMIEAQRHAMLLNQELAHRMKNMFAVVSAVIDQTFRTSSPEDSRKLIAQRLQALGHAHDILTRSRWSDAPLKDIVEQALRPHGNAEAIRLSGPSIYLSADQSLSMALAVHELATNATKYGALSVPSGKIDIRWQAGRAGTDDPFAFEWIEVDGPPVALPKRRGFGSRLLNRALAPQFGGAVGVMYRPEGLHFTLQTTMKRLRTETSAAA